jgi:hypothetical protein
VVGVKPTQEDYEQDPANKKWKPWNQNVNKE